MRTCRISDDALIARLIEANDAWHADMDTVYLAQCFHCQPRRMFAMLRKLEAAGHIERTGYARYGGHRWRPTEST